MCGASVLATQACLRVGAGKVTAHTPKRNSTILQISVPEAIIQFDREETTFSEAVDTEDFNALGIGPGLGTSEQTAIAIIAQLRRTQCPIVVDADAINILANHRAWLQQLPKGIIMTPHPKEFDRLEGPSNDSFERLMKARDLAAGSRIQSGKRMYCRHVSTRNGWRHRCTRIRRRECDSKRHYQESALRI